MYHPVITTATSRPHPHTQPRVLFLSSFVPRQYGLAAYTEELMSAMSAQHVSCSIIAMHRPGERYSYDRRVVATVQHDRPDDYLVAARRINDGNFDVVCVEHEFGIFGGEAGDRLIRLLEEIRIPIITTLHSLSERPSAEMWRQIRAIAARSSKLVVLNGLAIDILARVYSVGNVALLHQGACTPATPVATAAIKSRLGCADQYVISTFGLLAPDKGLEYAIQAMPDILRRHPNTRYYILGKTHPRVQQEHGERYRNELHALAHKLGIDKQVIFVNKYLSKDELLRYLQASDIYLAPQVDMQKYSGGTLPAAIANGRPIISTPYAQARYLLNEERGILVSPKSPSAIAEACELLLADPMCRARMERANREYGQQLQWARVSREYLDFCLQARPLPPHAALLRLMAVGI